MPIPCAEGKCDELKIGKATTCRGQERPIAGKLQLFRCAPTNESAAASSTCDCQRKRSSRSWKSSTAAKGRRCIIFKEPGSHRRGSNEAAHARSGSSTEYSRPGADMKLNSLAESSRDGTKADSRILWRTAESGKTGIRRTLPIKLRKAQTASRRHEDAAQ